MDVIRWIFPGRLLLLLISLPAETLSADLSTSTWAGGSGVWSDPSQWILPGTPQDGYQVLINNTAPQSRVTVDVPTAQLNNVGIASQAMLALAADLSTGELTSFGAVTVGNGATLNAGGGGFVQDGATAATTVSAGGNLLDTGTYSQGNGSTKISGRLTTPLFHVTGGTVTTGSGGVLTIGAGGYTQAAAVTTQIASGGLMNLTGDFSQGAGRTIVNGTLSTPLFHVTGGTVTTGTGGVLTIGAGGYTQDSAVTTQIASGGLMNLTGDFSQGAGRTIVNGTLSTPLLHVTGGSVTVGAGGDLAIGNGGYTQGAPGTTTTIAAGGLINAIGGSYSQEIGTSTTVDGTLTASRVNNSGTVVGSGTVNGDFNDLGTIAPGDGTTGSLLVSGNYDQTGFLDVDLDGPNSASILNVGGKALLNGTLDVSLLDGFVPVSGETFLVMTYESTSGGFYDIAGAGLPGDEFWNVTYGPNDLYLTVESTESTPEPATFLFLATDIAACLWARRILARRSRSQ